MESLILLSIFLGGVAIGYALFLSSQMNVIGDFSAPLNGVRPGYLAEMSSRQKQETRGCGLNGTHTTTSVENRSKPDGPA